MTQTGIQSLTPDTLVEGKYRIKRLLAEGGMGAVYHAVQEPLGRDVALKILKPQDDTPAKRAQREKRFFREAAVSSKLTHPNTITILDYGKLPDEAGFFLVMEYLAGKSLRELLVERGSLGTRVTLHITMQMASSLADAHRQGAVHRDLKPPNVMLVPRAEDPYFVKVVDFGLVKQLDAEEGEEELTAENSLVGSPMYMAPERFLSHTANSPGVDVYSLGIMMYEMLVGRPPFIREGDSTLQQIMMHHIQTDPPPMRSFRPDLDLPTGLDELVMRCLAKHPEDRIQSMDALLTLLRACAAGVGMAVAGPIEDTGAFMPPSGLARTMAPSGLSRLSDRAERSEADTVVDRAAAAAPPSTQSGEVAVAGAPKRSLAPFAIGGAVLLVLAIVAGVMLSGAPEPTHLIVNSTPSGATVWLGDRALGATPFDAPIDLGGPSTVKVEKEGFEPFEYRVMPKPGEQLMVDARLTASAPAEPTDVAVVPPVVVPDEPAEDPQPVVEPAVGKTEKTPKKKTGKDKSVDIKLDR